MQSDSNEQILKEEEPAVTEDQAYNPFLEEDEAPDQDDASVDLSEFDDEFSDTEAIDGSEVDDGKYQVRIDKAVLCESRNGNPMIKWDLVVISGIQLNRHIFKNAMITKDSLPFIKGDFKTLGQTINKFSSDLPGALERCLDKTLEVTKRTKGEFTNVYFNKVLAIPGSAGNDAIW